jgi:hypothetical protein
MDVPTDMHRMAELHIGITGLVVGTVPSPDVRPGPAGRWIPPITHGSEERMTRTTIDASTPGAVRRAAFTSAFPRVPPSRRGSVDA